MFSVTQFILIDLKGFRWKPIAGIALRTPIRLTARLAAHVPQSATPTPRRRAAWGTRVASYRTWRASLLPRPLGVPSPRLLEGYRRDFKPELYPQKHGQEDQDRVQRDPHDVGSPTPSLLYSLLAHGEFSLAQQCNGSPALAQSACHQTDGQVLGTNLNSSESTRRFWRSRL